MSNVTLYQGVPMGRSVHNVSTDSIANLCANESVPPTIRRRCARRAIVDITIMHRHRLAS